MLFVCVRCKFVFNRTEKPEVCPDCGCELVRDANDEENDEYKKAAKKERS